MKVRTALSVLVVFALLSSVSYACKCAVLPSGKEPNRYEGADVVFEGVAEKLRFVGPHADARPGELIPATSGVLRHEFTFKVLRNYKGATGDEIKIVTGLGMGDCGELFDPDIRYVVHADSAENGELVTGICDGNFPVEDTPDRSNARVCGTVLLPRNAASDSIALALIKSDKIGQRTVGHADAENDGTFCFEQVDPGEYLIAAVLGRENDYRDLSFYPGTVDASAAQRISVHPGDQITKLIFGFADFKLPSLSGRVVTTAAAKLPEEEMYVFLSGDNEAPFIPALFQKVDPTGVFTFPKLKPGKYELLLTVGVPGEDGSSPWLTRKVSVNLQEDMRGVELELMPRSSR